MPGSTEKQEISTEDTTITLTPSEDRINAIRDDFLDPENLRRHGWCNKEGTPWPKDEADLLQGGLWKPSEAQTAPTKDSASPPKDYFDEVELRKKKLATSSAGGRYGEQAGSEGEAKGRSYSPSHYGLSDKNPTVENYVTDAEINTRGYIDRYGRIYYAIPILPENNESKKGGKLPQGHVIVTNKRSERSIRNYNPDVESSSPKKADAAAATAAAAADSATDGVIGRIECRVGDNTDRGILHYLVHDSGRTYDMKCPDGRTVVLSFRNEVLSLIFFFHVR
ncbi:unnamed protein product [Gongylonema pulchrum]|uniref:Uncharacterized protein n=1 Tax=Gongylonema pulchrum TaxID=637853 RepID=A0A3P6QA67_9BILA|nr:unnamed protein product [Gongylonema pulchrum]